jgi:hypothetical protein
VAGVEVQSIKEHIAMTQGIPSVRQRLVHSGKQLVSERLLSSYPVLPDSTLHLALP